MKFISRAFLLLTLCVSVLACKDKRNTATPTTTSIGGKGGLATMHVAMDHDTFYVDSGMVYMKYNALVMPADKKFDDSSKMIMVQGKPVAIFTELKPGNYFLYGKGWDIKRSKTVYGTRPYTIDPSSAEGYATLVMLVGTTPQ